MPSQLPPGPRYPAVLTTYKWQRQTVALLEEGRDRFGDIWTLRLMGGATFVVVSDPTLAKEALGGDPTLLHSESKLATRLMGENSVLVLDENAHEAQRKLLSPLFHGERVQRYRELIARLCENELASWPLHEPIRLLPRMDAITLRMIMHVIFGLSGDAAQDELRGRVHDLMGWAAGQRRMLWHQVKFSRQWTPSRSFLRVREPLDRVVFEVIDRARQDPQLEDRDDALAMLLKARHDDGSPMTDRELRDELVTLLIQGHASTGNGLAWALERILRHPEVLERLRAEAQTENEEYLDAVIKETLRVRPPIPWATRRVVKQPYQLGEYELEPGTVIAGSIYLLHRRADVYPEPDRFRPERFLEPEASTYTWMPFGGGGRACIGASLAMTELRVVLRTLVQQARLVPAEDRDEEIVRRGVGFSPSRGARAVLEERMPAAVTASPTA